MQTLYISETLRNDLLKSKGLYNAFLPFFWDDNLKEDIFNVALDSDIEYLLSNCTLKDVYIHGLNFGKCGLTSRYLIKVFDKINKNLSVKKDPPLLHMGKCQILKGTKNSPNGEHSFVEFDGFIYCPTLMVKIPKERHTCFEYEIIKTMSYDSARMLSEYDTYSCGFKELLDHLK